MERSVFFEGIQKFKVNGYEYLIQKEKYCAANGSNTKYILSKIEPDDVPVIAFITSAVVHMNGRAYRRCASEMVHSRFNHLDSIAVSEAERFIEKLEKKKKR